MNRRLRNRIVQTDGVALLATLLAVTLMTFLVVDFTYSATVAYRAAANQANEMRAAYLARSGINVGIGLLDQDARMDSKAPEPYDGLTDIWATPFPPLPVDGGYVALSIIDENRKLNINQLVNPSTGQVNPLVRDQFSRLFQILGLPADLLPALVDWLDADSVPSTGGAESQYYLTLAPPYEPRNGPMPTIADLGMVKGIDEPTFLMLSRFITTAPSPRSISTPHRPSLSLRCCPNFKQVRTSSKRLSPSESRRPSRTRLISARCLPSRRCTKSCLS
jgi:general secretion pathway protein K